MLLTWPPFGQSYILPRSSIYQGKNLHIKYMIVGNLDSET